MCLQPIPSLLLILGALTAYRQAALQQRDVWLTAIIVSFIGTISWFFAMKSLELLSMSGSVLEAILPPIAGFWLVPGGIGFMRSKLEGADTANALRAGVTSYLPPRPLAQVPASWPTALSNLLRAAAHESGPKRTVSTPRTSETKIESSQTGVGAPPPPPVTPSPPPSGRLHVGEDFSLDCFR